MNEFWTKPVSDVFFLIKDLSLPFWFSPILFQLFQHINPNSKYKCNLHHLDPAKVCKQHVDQLCPPEMTRTFVDVFTGNSSRN